MRTTRRTFVRAAGAGAIRGAADGDVETFLEGLPLGEPDHRHGGDGVEPDGHGAGEPVPGLVPEHAAGGDPPLLSHVFKPMWW